jgi:hypothetical protein
MLFGTASFAETPFASLPTDGNAEVIVNVNSININIGSVGIIADAVTEDLTPNAVSLGTGTLTITADANHTVTANPLSLDIGTFVVTADANTSVTGNSLTLATGNVTVTGEANVLPTGNALSLDTVEPGVITWNDIIPGATMVWTPIKPY